MADDHLEESWSVTRGHLARARAALPPGSGELSQYVEFLDHNELALAMQELESMGDLHGAAAGFWLALADAAEQMTLTATAARYRATAQSGVEDSRAL